MKKVFGTITVTLAFCLFIVQDARSQIDFGTKVGATTTSVSSNGNFSGKARYSYQGGLYLSFEAPMVIGVQAEALYSRTVLESLSPANGLANNLMTVINDVNRSLTFPKL